MEIMKKISLKKAAVVVGIVFCLILSFRACGKKGPTEDELTADLSNCRYSVYSLSIKVGALVNECVDDYRIAYYTPTEAVRKGYISHTSSYVTDKELSKNTYIACISGGVRPNLSLPSYTIDTSKALVAILVYDDDGNLSKSTVHYIDDNLNAGAIQMMTSPY